MKTYYNRKGQILEMKRKLQYLAEGNCGSIYHDNEIIFKQYRDDIHSSCKLTPKMFDILKNINSDHLVKLYEIYSKINLLDLNKIKYLELQGVKNRNFIVDAYTAQYYSDNTVDVLNESTDYILDNFNEIEKLINLFTKRSILTSDLRRDNVILSHNGIIIIDPDTYRISPLNKQSICLENKQNLLTLFSSICGNCLKDDENRIANIQKIVLDLANIDIDDKTEITYELSKKLKHVKKPIDYLIK